MPKDTFHEDFIRELQGRYAGILRSHVPPAAPLNGQEVPGVPPMQAQAEGPGVRFTGNGPDNLLQEEEPAGVVHEGEQVVEADMVQNAGGPEKVRDTLEDLVQLEKKKPGFQEGTGSEVVGDVEELNQPTATPTQVTSVPAEGFNLPQATPTQVTNPPSEGFTPPTVTPTETFEPFKVPKLPDVEGVTPPTVTPTDVGVPEISPLDEGPEETAAARAQRIGMGGLEDIAAGESKAAELERRQAETELKGRARAEQIAAGQQLAASGASPEAARAAMAGQGIEQRAAAVEMQSNLAISAAERAETAMGKLAALGIDLEKLGIDKSMAELGWAQLKENSEQFGATHALNTLRTNMEIQGPIMNTLLERGGVEGLDEVQGILEGMGVNIDLGSITDDIMRGEAAQAAANVTSLLYEDPTMTADSPRMAVELENMWKNIPDAQKTGIDKDQWMDNQVSGIKIGLDPIASTVASLGNDTIELFVAGALTEGQTIDDFEFLGRTGMDAAKLAVTALFMPGGGMTITADGMEFTEGGAISALFGGGTGSGGTLVTEGGSTMEVSPIDTETPTEGVTTPTATLQTGGRDLLPMANITPEPTDKTQQEAGLYLDDLLVDNNDVNSRTAATLSGITENIFSSSEHLRRGDRPEGMASQVWEGEEAAKTYNPIISDAIKNHRGEIKDFDANYGALSTDKNPWYAKNSVWEYTQEGLIMGYYWANVDAGLDKNEAADLTGLMFGSDPWKSAFKNVTGDDFTGV